MKNGFKVYDTDTHVMPVAEVLEQYVDPDFRLRLSEIAAFRVPAGERAEGAEPRCACGSSAGRRAGLGT